MKKSINKKSKIVIVDLTADKLTAALTALTLLVAESNPKKIRSV